MINGNEKSIKEWCEYYGIKRETVMYRVKVMGMSPEQALSVPKYSKKEKRKIS